MRNCAGSAVEFVSNDRMMQRGEMYANLVGAAGVELDFDERGGVDSGEGAPVGASFAGFGQRRGAAGGHAHAVFGIAPDS